MHMGNAQPGKEPGKETGTVKWFDDAKGYGFITADQGKDVFLHIKNLRKSALGKDDIGKGDRLRYDTEQGPRGPVAVNIGRE